uniref:Uncharacterized protein n=1 Tax=Sphaeramia orbicularis TaxID=375764 RepID=A0A672ZQ10_9TELE
NCIKNCFYFIVFTQFITLLLHFFKYTRKYHRHHHCKQRRCFPLHSRVPFP